MLPRHALYIAPCVLLVGCVDCGDLDRTGGNSGKGYFIADVVDIAVGAKADLHIKDYEFLQDPQVTGVRIFDSSDEDVFEVIERDTEGRASLLGTGAGTAELEFEGEADGEMIEDTFEVRVYPPLGVSWGACGLGSDEVTVVRGQRAVVPFTFLSFGDQPMTGYGLYPFILSPETAASIDVHARVPGALNLDVSANATAELNITARLADRSPLLVHVVDASAVDRLDTPTAGTIYPNEEVYLPLEAYAGGRPVCTGETWRVRVDDDDICKLLVDGEEEREWEGSAHQIVVRALRAGTCKLVVELVGLVAATTITHEILERPSSGDGIDFD